MLKDLPEPSDPYLSSHYLQGLAAKGTIYSPFPLFFVHIQRAKTSEILEVFTERKYY